MAAQLTHASGESMEFGSFMGDLSRTYCEVCTTRPGRSSAHEGCGRCMGHGFLPLPIHAVVLEVRDESSLLELDAALDAAGVSHRLVLEPDAPWNGQATAIGIEPTKDRAKLRPFLRKLKLLKGDS
jgi:hypothetical protein